jgi:nicotinamidase/pyrazinamidase
MSTPSLYPCLIIVDVQNDYVLPSGALPCPDALAIIPHIHSAAHSSFFSAGVYFSADDKDPVVESIIGSLSSRWPPHCISGSFGAQIHAGLCHEDVPGAVITTKRNSMSAFGSAGKGEITGLNLHLQQRPPSHAVVCGLALECVAFASCIQFTARNTAAGTVSWRLLWIALPSSFLPAWCLMVAGTSG